MGDGESRLPGATTEPQSGDSDLVSAREVEVRAMELTDIPALAALMRRHDEWIGAYKVSPPDSSTGAVQLLTWQLARHRRAEAWCGVITEAGVLRGQAALIAWPDDSTQREVVLWVEPEAGGRGLGRRAVQALCAVGFEELGLPVIYSRVHGENRRSRAIFERVGFEPVTTNGRWVTLQLRRDDSGR